MIFEKPACEKCGEYNRYCSACHDVILNKLERIGELLVGATDRPWYVLHEIKGVLEK